MKKLSILILLSSLYINLYAQQITLSSPNGKLVSTIKTKDKISATLLLNGEECFSINEMGLVGEAGLYFGEKIKVKKKIEAGKHDFHPPVPSKVSHITDAYNEAEIKLTKNQTLRIRLYNDGLAYRFETSFKNQTQEIIDEKMAISFPDGTKSLFPFEESTMSSYERYHFDVNVKDIEDEKFCSLPVLFYNEDSRIVYTENDVLDYPNMFLEKKGNGFIAKFPKVPSKVKKVGDRDEKIEETHPYIAKTNGTRNFPWRVFMVADDDEKLLKSSFIQALSSPSVIEDPTWIKPGIVMWDWWNANNIKGVDFRAGINNNTYKYYIDAASHYKASYIMLDEGWTKSTTDLMNEAPDIDVSELVKYANSKGVDVLLWTLWTPLMENIEEILDLYAAWGVKGIKIDFMQRADQEMVNVYERIASEAAKRKLLVDFHGAYKPGGLRFKYPNVINQEGVLGLETSKWSKVISPKHNINLIFTRMMAGPMDYTPGALSNFHSKEFPINFDRPSSVGTRAHQVALFTLFESPLQMMADAPDKYMEETETAEFISKSKVVWDNLVVLDAKIMEHVAIARNSGSSWYIGAINNSEKYSKSFQLDFLEDGKSYNMTIFKDGINADRHAEDYKIETKTVKKGDSVLIEMAVEGGWSAQIEQ